MGKTKRMDQVIQLLKTYQLNQSVKATARQHRVSKNTVRHYLRRCRAFDGTLEQLLDLPEAELHAVLYAADSRLNDERKVIFEGKVDYFISELKRAGVTRSLLFEEYRRDHPDGYAKTQFFDYLRRAIARRDLTMVLRHEAGKTLSWIDRASGQVHQCQVLVGLMAHSHYTFVIALHDQSVAEFCHGINETLRFLGGVPRVILSDNLKAFVTRADRYEPKFNQACEQLAAHYGCDLQAARVRKPRDKAGVENAVRTVYTRLFAPLRDREFYSLDELNAALLEQAHRHNATAFQRRAGSRTSVFEQNERALLAPLPAIPFALKTTVRAKVQRNYHVYLGQRANFYSVPFAYVGQNATVVYDRNVVEIYVKTKRVAIHQRLHPKDRYCYRTDTRHLPRAHAEWQKTQGYKDTDFIRRAEQIGEHTRWAIEQVLESKRHREQTYRSCQGVLALAKKYTDQRLEDAARRCAQTAGRANYQMLKNILERRLDIEPHPPYQAPEHDNVRGAQTYQ